MSVVSCKSGDGTVMNMSASAEAETAVDELGIFSRAKLIQPNTSAVIGKIDKVLMQDTLLYLLSRDQMEVFITSTSGRVINVISARGQGDKEYASISDIFIDDAHKTLNVVSRQDYKLLTYDALGALTKVQRLPMQFVAMERLNGGKYIGYMGNYPVDSKSPYNVWILNPDMSVDAHFASIDPIHESRYSESHNVFTKSSDGCLAICDDSFTAWQVTGSGVVLDSLYLDFVQLALPKHAGADNEDVKKSLNIQSRYVCDVARLQETSSVILAFYVLKGQTNLVTYNKLTQQVTKTELSSSTTDLFPISFGRVVGSDEHHIFTVVDSEIVQDIYVGHNAYNDFDALYPEQCRNLRRKISSPIGNDNPCIIIYNVD